MTGFTAPPSTTDSTTHLFKCVPGQDFYHPQVEYTRTRVVIRFQINGTRIIPVLVPYCFTIKLVNYGYDNAITQLASNLNCDFNALNNAICCVRSGIQEVAGNVNFSAERVINAINLGDANLTSALQNCCCQTQQNIIKMGYENQLGQKDIVNQMQTGFSQTNSGLERAASNLGFQMSQIACDLKTNANANTQRIVDVLNNHWQSDLQQRYNDARLELSQQKQNATLIAALKTTAAA